MDLLASPKVSVVIPTFCRPESTKRALSSVVAQTFSDFEIIVVDDGSSDDTMQVVQGLGIDRLRVIRHETNRGPAAARNTAVAVAKGEWIAFLDSDDVWKPEKLARQMTRLQAAPANVSACATGYYLHKGGRELTIIPNLPPGTFRFNILFGCAISPGTTLLVKRKVFDEIGLFDERLRRLEDWDWLLRYAQHYDIVFVPEPLANIYLRPLKVDEQANPDPVFEAIERIKGKHLPLQPSRMDRRQLASSLLVEKAAHLFRSGRALQAGFYIVAAFMYFPYRNAGFFRTLMNSVVSILTRSSR